MAKQACAGPCPDPPSTPASGDARACTSARLSVSTPRPEGVAWKLLPTNLRMKERT